MSAVSINPYARAAFPIEPVVQRYAWGKLGTQSLVGQLSNLGAAHPSTPFAELWYGAHHKAPSVVRSAADARPLDLVIAEDPEGLLGSASVTAFGPTLPFLFKVLSVAHPLSIQLHPDHATAARLHARFPEHYPDDSHKPELAIAMTKVELLRGFRSGAEISRLLRDFDAFRSMTSADAFGSADHETFMRSYLGELFAASPETRVRMSESISSRLATMSDENSEWFGRARSASDPADPGVLLVLLMRRVALEPGEATFIGPNLPHAYLIGDLLECMANSDNVVRAGITPKYIDIDAFLATVDVRDSSDVRLVPSSKGAGTLFAPPSREFQVMRYDGAVADEALPHGTISIVVCLSGTSAIRSSGQIGEVVLAAGEGAVNPAGADSAVRVESGTTIVAYSQIA